MIMTPEEQKDMLDLIKESKRINAAKTDLMEELIQMARAVATQNAILTEENKQLKKQLDLAEKQILRCSVPKVTNEIN